MNLFVRIALFSTAAPTVSALKTGYLAIGASAREPSVRSENHAPSSVVLDSEGELEHPIRLRGSAAPQEAVVANSSELRPVLETRTLKHPTRKLHAARSRGAARRKKAAARSKSAIKTPLTLAQILSRAWTSSSQQLSTVHMSASYVTEKGNATLIVVLIFFLLPLMFIGAALTAPLWSRQGSEKVPSPAGSALLEKKTAQDQAPPVMSDGDPADMAWRTTVAQQAISSKANSSPPGSMDMSQLGMMSGALGFAGRQGRSNGPSADNYGDVLVPEMVITDPTGAQFVLKGDMQPHQQVGIVEVHRLTSDLRETDVMNIIMSETNENGGIIMEWPTGRAPMAFLKTDAAIPPKGQLPRKDQLIHIVPCFSQAFQANTPPFAAVEAMPGGVLIKRCGTGKVIFRLNAGGNNIDYANIVDGNGKLVASMTNRGQSLSGKQLVKPNQRVISLAQGADAVLVVSAVVACTKFGITKFF